MFKAKSITNHTRQKFHKIKISLKAVEFFECTIQTPFDLKESYRSELNAL